MSKPDKYLVYTADKIRAVATHGSDVILEVELPDAGLMPGVTLAFRLEPEHARSLGQLLIQKADAAGN